MDILRKILILLALFSVVGILFSYIFPGKVVIVDDMRLFMQRPIIRWFGKIKADDFPVVFSEELPGEIDIDYSELQIVLEDLPVGSIFFTTTRSYAITEFIPGKWKHTGIFLGNKGGVAMTFGVESELYGRLDSLMNEEGYYVLDSRAEGVKVHPIIDLSNMRENSYLTGFAAFSPDMSIADQEKFIMEALYYLDREYDFDWLTEDDESIFCSELLYIALRRVGVDIPQRTSTFSREVITPDNLFDSLIGNSTELGNSFDFHVGLSKNNGILERKSLWEEENAHIQSEGKMP
jgi:hypothetical protein